jgi:hypothetical protein
MRSQAVSSYSSLNGDYRFSQIVRDQFWLSNKSVTFYSQEFQYLSVLSAFTEVPSIIAYE